MIRRVAGGSHGSGREPVWCGLCLFFWNCAWVYLAATLTRRQRTGVTNWIALIVLLGFVGVYVEQFRDCKVELVDADHRILMLMFLLELIGLLLGVMCILLGAARSYLLMIVGFSLFAAPTSWKSTSI